MDPAGGQWYSQALLVRADRGQLQIQPLGFRAAGTFPSLAAANRAAAELARQWIDKQPP
jgi:hypothetical protein